MSLGQKWKEELGLTPAHFDHSEKVTQWSAQHIEREWIATEEVALLKSKWLPEGIASCVRRGSNVLGIGLPGDVIGTQALADFLDWAEAEGLTVRFDMRPCDTGREKTGFDLVFLPK